MTASTSDRSAPQYGTPDSVVPFLISLPMAAATTIYAGTMAGADASGNAVGASASTAIRLAGRAESQVVNSGAAGALRINVKPGVFAFVNSAAGVDLIAAANVFSYCYAADNQTVALTDGGGTRPIAGVIFPFDPNNPTAVQVGVGVGFSVPSNPNAPSPGGSVAFKARGAAFTNHSLTAFTVATNTDGITYVAGDVVLLTAQTTAAENGPYVVGTVATTAPLTRPDWWVAGSAIAQGQVIQVGGEGTIFGGSEWKALCAKSKIVGTDDPVFYPRVCKGTVTLVAGTITLGSTQGLFLKSTTASSILITPNTANTTTSTVTYGAAVASRTAGVSGTAAAVLQARVAAGTINVADISTLDFLVTNW